MPLIEIEGLKGLPGLNHLSEKEKTAFYERNKSILNNQNFSNPLVMNAAAEVLYNNKLFKDKYGQDFFNEYNNGTEESYLFRNNLLKNDIVNEAWKNYLYPYDINGDLKDKHQEGNYWTVQDWNKYSEMSADGKIKLMQSHWLSPKEFNETERKKVEQKDNSINDFLKKPTLKNYFHQFGLAGPSGSSGFSNSEQAAIQEYEAMDREAGRQRRKEANQKILDNIYNDDLKNQTYQLKNIVQNTYLTDPEITQLSDDNVKKSFYHQFIDENSDMVKQNQGELASHWGSSELKDLSIDDMRQWLAKKKVYMQNMSPLAACTALNNEAKEYIKDHQGTFKRMGLFLKDVGISALSYSADKINGFYDLGLMATDALFDKPTVYIDEENHIIDPKKTSIQTDYLGNSYYTDSQKVVHPVKAISVNRTTLHNMGKNFDGSEDESILNPQYWSRAEQFSTLNSDKQKKYEKLGSSPYKVAYNPNEDTDLWYEAFKMMSFQLGDGASQFIPFGIGAAGKILSTANKVGRIGRELGKALDFGGRALTAQTKFGQVAQGTASALGIAYAYNRGAFQETLAQNLANVEETVNNKARHDVIQKYQNDPTFKNTVDAEIQKRAEKSVQDYIHQLPKDQKVIINSDALLKNAKRQEGARYIGELINKHSQELKQNPDYSKLQQEAINSTGDAATTTFLPEAVKYGFVNTIGFRKYLFTNPAGVTKKVSNTFKGLREITTEGGKKRLATEASKFLTKGQKWKQLGKAAASQAWGGAWTNGTDDMMTDAAERINSDSFDRYLNGFYNGEAMADTYGFADGLYSYFKGFSNSLGQETTRNATLVGALGSFVSTGPNMTNIAHLVTKSGRENYKSTFWQEVQRSEDGIIQKNEDGSPKVKKLSKVHDLPAQLNYFIQNGVLNTYYGKKQAEKDLQSHADYVNNILDDYNDFKDIEGLIASDKALDDVNNFGDQKTVRFIKAIHAINALNNLANNSKDPTVMSSVVQNAKAQIKLLSNMQFDPKTDNIPQTKEIQNLLSQYYAANPSIPQDDNTAKQGLATMINNAKELKDATDAYNKAEDEIAKAEKIYGQPFAYSVREKLKFNQALDGHWRKRLDSMKQMIGEPSVSQDDIEIKDDEILPSLGGKKNAQLLVRAYEKQKKELDDERKEQQRIVDEKQQKVKDSQKKLDNNIDESKTYKLQKEVHEAQAELDDAKLQLAYIDNQIAFTNSKQTRVSDAIAASEKEGATTKQVLTADEIFSLDPKTRARMMKKENRDLYSDEQKAEIEKLEHELIMRDADALQKIQDIATLSQRMKSNREAYNKIIENPEAAAIRFEAQRSADAITAYHFINQRNAQSIVAFINEFDNAMKPHSDINKETKEKFVYRSLRKFNTDLLDIIDNDHLLPQYQQQVNQAKEWSTVIEDLNSVISAQTDKDQTWKNNIKQNIDNIIEIANNRDEIISNIEKAIDDVENPQAKQDLDLILKGMEKIGYQRDTSILENRKKKKEREEEARNKIEEEKKKASDAADVAAKKAAENEAKKDISESEIPANGKGLINAEPITPEDAATKNEVNKDTEQTGIGKSVSLWASSLMDNEAEEGTVDAGEMWTGTKEKAKQGNFKVTLKKQDHSEERVIQFSLDDHPESLVIYPGEWQANEFETQKMKADSIDKDAVFHADSMYYSSGHWNFKGHFDGNSAEYRLRANTDFNLDQAIERQKSQREADLVSQGINTNDPNIIINDDHVEVVSENLDQQNKELNNNSKKQRVDNSIDVSTANSVGENSIENNGNTLSGNAMAEYDSVELKENGILKHKQGAKPNDSMSKFYAWMKNADVHLQNIIDDELANILVQNPHLKIKFMVVKPENNATHDIDVQNHLFLVLDYDDAINKSITKIHHKDNGGVIRSNNKQYLIIGITGYGNRSNTDKLALYDILYSNNPHSVNGYGLVRKGMKKYFDEHPDDRFYIPENLETEIVSNSLIPGYIVRQLENDSHPKYRSIFELLKDPKRNPHDLDFSSLSWGIQAYSEYILVNPKGLAIPYMGLRNKIRNVGNAFVLVPASNGKKIPIYLKPLFYTEMHDGKLKNRINELLNQVISVNYNTRLQAVVELSKIFYFDTKEKHGDNILLRQSRAEISLVSNGEVFATFTLDSNFDRQAFLDAFSDMNPRINITAKVLKNESLLKEWDEAGALETDAAKLGTAGSSYSIYGIDSNGNMLIPKKTVDNNQYQKPKDSDYRRDNRFQIVFKHRYYTFEEGQYYLDGILVTDDYTLQQLEYNQRIINNNLAPEKTEHKWSYYILSQGDNPEVVKVNNNTKEVIKLSDEDAKKLLEEKAKKEAEKQREKAAKEALKQNPKNDKNTGKTVDTKNTDDLLAETFGSDFVISTRKSKTGKSLETYTITSKDNDGTIHVKVKERKSDTKEDVVSTAFAPIPDGWRIFQDNFKITDNPNLQVLGFKEVKIKDGKIIGEIVVKDDQGFATYTVKLEKDTTEKSSVPTASITSSSYKATSATQTFVQLYKNPKYMIMISKLVKNKWADVPRKPHDLYQFLKEKNIEVDAIGTSDADIEAWIKTVEDCR